LLDVGQVRAKQPTGDQFSAALKTLHLPVSSLVLSAADPAAARVQLGEVRIDEPAFRLTRTKEGIVLPVAKAGGAEPAPTPAATPVAARTTPDVQIAALRVTKGRIQFSDSAVQPPFATTYAPLEIDARNLRYPDISIKPLRLDIRTSDQGRITLTGDIAGDATVLELKLDGVALTPYNSYATAYSPYSLSDGSLTLTMSAKRAAGGTYDLSNSITLHQLSLGSADEAGFEQQFGVPLSLALALLRDVRGDISLNVPLAIDSSGGAQVNLGAVIRSALRGAVSGAIQSPLKLLGAVAGGGGGPVLPAPIPFRSGASDLTKEGTKNADRLAEFLNGRPGMGVRLDAAVTTGDVQRLREQALRAEWEDENFLKASIGFLTQRSARDRIRNAIDARARGKRSKLSAEDEATLKKWLDERPSPTTDQLHALAAARLDQVDAALRAKGIDPARVTRAEPAAPAEGKPLVRITLQLAEAAPNPAGEGTNLDNQEKATDSAP
jgi:hypothetical protein